ncbi:MAG TPA: hypothetical protein VFG72_17135 [Marmoricola sp.]|nr:hypothetical protein [Marmoricola sp.]
MASLLVALMVVLFLLLGLGLVLAFTKLVRAEQQKVREMTATNRDA